MNNLTQLIINAISRDILPKNNVLLKICSNDISASITFASALSNVLSDIIQADVSICGEDNIEMNCSIPGELKSIAESTIVIANMVKEGFNNKYNTDIEVSIKLNKVSSLNKLGIAKIELIKESFIRKMPNGKYRVVSRKGKNLGEYGSRGEAVKRLQQVEFFKHKKAENFRLLAKTLRAEGKNELCDDVLISLAKTTGAADPMADLSYSFIMRNLRKKDKDKAREFQKVFKKAFDEGYESGIKDYAEVALFTSIKELDIKPEDLNKSD